VYDLERDHYADPHQKRLLRIDAHNNLYQQEGLGGGRGPHHADRLWVRSPKLKNKCGEIAKHGKYIRLIVDYGTPASLVGAWLCEMLKDSLAREIEWAGGHILFIPKPSPELLAAGFEKLIRPPGVYYAVVFSDDMCYAIRSRDGSGVIKRFNKDISSCDKSHGSAVFAAYKSCFPEDYQDAIEVLTEACRLALTVRDPTDPTGRRKLKLKPKVDPNMGSGTNITTTLNTIVAQTICARAGERRAETAGELAYSAATIGYLLDIQPLDDWSELLFLKNMPVLDTDGDLVAVIALGVLLRASGTCKGDLPGRGDLGPRAFEFQSGLLRGFYPTVRIPMIQRMKARFNATIGDAVEKRILDMTFGKVDGDVVVEALRGKEPTRDVSDESFLRRYKLTPAETIDVQDFFSGEVGQTFSSPGLAKVLLADYQLGCM